MLHTKIVDSKERKLLIIEAEKFISSSNFGASIIFQERLEIKITIKLLLELLMIVMMNLLLKVLKKFIMKQIKN